ncbi:PLP-dependent aminotransferase family protein [Candidatus Formimonas warabiya]|uniref:HTH gntR-type domain-containing protein n=1 Tax=Formimonas warabiya TaxID=1761012 RepID=A0A3G1KYC0_FORW1|nr:PLP-dependent aminotransferase family protein [Candidatus Formimonas warabiya]ATW27387.1 hypothetical protein DCMF_23885 [Candidatus Formimonas warabiya]
MLVLDEKSKTPLYAQLYQQIKDDIVKGCVKAGTKLRSSRKISQELHISRNTVELAYEQLHAEGFIVSKPRKGYFVEAGAEETFQKSKTAPNTRTAAMEDVNQKVVYDFRPCALYLREAPFPQWQRLMNRCFHDFKEGVIRYGSSFGEWSLRTEIQRYISDYRNVHCKVDQIMVGTGTQFCLGLVCPLLRERGFSVAMEEPGDDQARMTLQNNGIKISPIEVDKEGLNVRVLEGAEARAVYVTPSHQFPTGTVMPMTRRLELVEWARRRDALIIEDDDSCHFQYDTKPLPSLQSLCGDRVIYLGSFSEMLFPCIQASYMVMPDPYLQDLYQRFENHTPLVPFLMQKTLELYIRGGHWESHVRKTRKHQKEKCASLVQALKSEFGNNICILGTHAGFHLLVQVKWPMNEAELIHRACQAGVGVCPTSKYWIRPQNSAYGTVLLSFRGIPLEHIPRAVKLLREAWLG